jgi:hypothetical protein
MEHKTMHVPASSSSMPAGMPMPMPAGMQMPTPATAAAPAPVAAAKPQRTGTLVDVNA